MGETSQQINAGLVEEVETFADPEEILRELFIRFGKRAAIGTSGQLTGSVMIDMAVRAGIKPRVFTLDTLRLFPESYQFFDELETRYGITIERMKPDPAKLEKMIAEHGEYLFFDTKAKQELCCQLRKVEPNERALDTLDVWFSGLRRDQSLSRADTPRAEMILHGEADRPILKVAPLVDWDEARLRAYIKEHDVPIHKLLQWQQEGWHYESLGCIICTTPIGPHESRRGGRWRWFNGVGDTGDAEDHKECGLHTSHKVAK